MTAYIIRRLIYAVPTLLGVSMLIFLAMRVLPGDPLTAMYGTQVVTVREADRERIEAELGLSDPLVVQYGNWLKDIGKGELGTSFWRDDKVSDLIKRRGPLTLEIAVLSILVSWLVGLPVGIVSALKQNSLLDYAARLFTVAFLAIPAFWLASLMVLLMVLKFGYAPPLGTIDLWEDPKKNLEIVWGPSVVLGLAVSAYIARMTRSTLLEVIREDYIRTARAKGLAEMIVVLRHALRNALLPVITLSGVLFGFLLGGTVVVEQAFNVPGLGRAMIAAIIELDYIVIQNLVLLYAAAFVVINLITDLSYAFLDPKVRFS